MLYFNGNSKNDRKRIYKEVFSVKRDIDKLVIVTGYVGPQMVRDLEKLPYKEIIVVVGMYGKSIDINLHLALLKNSNEIKKLKIFYTDMLVHTKCYIWYKNQKIQELMVGSANFSTSGLLDNPYKEILHKITNIDKVQGYKEYLEYIYQNMYECNNLEYDDKQISRAAEKKKNYTVNNSEEKFELSLLANTNGRGENIIEIGNKAGDVHAASGLNWGYSSGSPMLGDAYIAISSKNITESSIIPSKTEGENKPVEVIWDDGKVMSVLFEGNGPSKDGLLYPKQISSYNNKKELGDYLRTRIGEKIGVQLNFEDEFVEKLKELKTQYKGVDNKENLIKAIKSNSALYKALTDKMIKKEHLELYGRSGITVTLISEGLYYFNFSVNK